MVVFFFFFFQAEDGIRDYKVTGVQTCALPISQDDHPRPAPQVCGSAQPPRRDLRVSQYFCTQLTFPGDPDRSEEHTSELQSPCNLVCRLLLEKKKQYCRIQLRTPYAAPALRRS